MNNGEVPTTVNEAIIFYQENGTALFGTDLMFEPDNGKLAYGRGRLNLIFAHFNNFGEKGCHTGDTYYSFDHTGREDTANYAWGWQASHSLIQAHFYDGRYFVSSALGDTGSLGVIVDVIDVNKFRDDYDPEKKRKDRIFNAQLGKVGGPIVGKRKIRWYYELWRLLCCCLFN